MRGQWSGLAILGLIAVSLLAISEVAVAGPKGKGKGKQHAAKKEQTLYQQLGGKKAIVAVVDDFVTRCAKDSRISSFFNETAGDPKRLKKFKNHLVNQICEAAGGPCRYKGRDMRTAHAGMAIQDEHFNALVEDLQATFKKFKIKGEHQDALLGVLGPMRADIVEPGAVRATASEGEDTGLDPAPPPAED